jgi:hypothetical protein
MSAQTSTDESVGLFATDEMYADADAVIPVICSDPEDGSCCFRGGHPRRILEQAGISMIRLAPFMGRRIPTTKHWEDT